MSVSKQIRGDDKELVRQALSGDNSAYDRLLKGLEPELRPYLAGLVRSAPDVAVDDVLQEVRLYLYQRLDRYNPEYPVAVFARGLARNVAKRFLYGKRDLLPAGFGEDLEERDPTDLSPLELGSLPLTFRQVVGEGRFEGPGGAEPPSRVFLELFEVFLRWGGYPHQQVSFGYSILLWGKEKRRSSKGADETARAMPSEKVPVTGDPDRVVREVGPKKLRSASGGMLDEIRSLGNLEPEYLGRARRPLEGRLRMSGRELFERDAASKQRFRELAEREIGLTRLRDYFGGDARKSVSEWTHAVKNRVKRAFLDPASQRRIPLPDPGERPREP